MIYYRINAKKQFPTNMLEYLVIHNSYVTSAMMEPIGDIKYHLHHLHLEQYFILKQIFENFMLAFMCPYFSSDKVIVKGRITNIQC